MLGRTHIQRVLLLALGFGIAFAGAAGCGEAETRAPDADGGRPPGDVVVDVDGNAYRTVTIGAQVWLAENLRVVHYRDRTAILGVAGREEWSWARMGMYCPPERDPLASEEAYGLLYNFRAVADGRGLCPEGWHVPTAAEWRALIAYLGGDETAGAKMKETRSGLWRTPLPGSTNESGFSALPAGGRGLLGGAGEAGYYATWWSSTSSDATYAWHWGLYPDKHGIRSNPGHKASGFSVRCVQD